MGCRTAGRHRTVSILSIRETGAWIWTTTASRTSEEWAAGTLPTESDTDGDGVSDATEVMAQQNPLDPVDNVPVANAGQDQESDPTVVKLDGSGSFDPNGDPLSYTWSQVEGTDVTLSDVHAMGPTFLERRWGRYGFRLVVNDGRVGSYPDEVLITIRNVPPTADAGTDQVVDAGSSGCSRWLRNKGCERGSDRLLMDPDRGAVGPDARG